MFVFYLQGSPIGRSSTPIDCVGSPHSPSGSASGPSQQYPDAMAMAGQNYQHFMELTNDVQKLSVVCEKKNNHICAIFFFLFFLLASFNLLLYLLPHVRGASIKRITSTFL